VNKYITYIAFFAKYEVMQGENEYLAVLNHLYEKSLVLHDPALFNKVLYFFFLDSIAHIDYTISLYFAAS
jgi:hypothetical protein